MAGARTLQASADKATVQNDKRSAPSGRYRGSNAGAEKTDRRGAAIAGKKKKTSAAQPGQRGKYAKWLTPSGLELLGAWARDGCTDEDLAKKIGVAPSTFYDWKRRFPDIAEAVSKGKEIVDIKVENALLKRALGYTYTEVKKEGAVNGIKNGTAKVTVTEKTMPPNVAAIIFWLKNRKPEVWREIITETQELLEDDNFLEALNEKAASVWQEKA